MAGETGGWVFARDVVRKPSGRLISNLGECSKRGLGSPTYEMCSDRRGKSTDHDRQPVTPTSQAITWDLRRCSCHARRSVDCISSAALWDKCV